MKKRFEPTDLPERLHYTKYYEHDGLLRAYANRTMVLTRSFAVIAPASLCFAIYVRVQPAPAVRVEAEGHATAVGASPDTAKTSPLSTLAVQAAGDTAPTELEAKAIVRRFLENYLAYTPATVEQNFATAFNMMTGNLRTYSLGKLRDDDTVGK